MRASTAAAAGIVILLGACHASEANRANEMQANPANSRAVHTGTMTDNGRSSTSATPGSSVSSVMHERHEGMHSIGKANKAIRDELEKSSPDLGNLRSSAKQIANFSQKASGWFPEGSGPQAGKTGAKPEIWQNPGDFKNKLSAFQKAALEVQAATSGNDLNAIRGRLDELSRTCKACHSKYRTDMHHH